MSVHSKQGKGLDGGGGGGQGVDLVRLTLDKCFVAGIENFNIRTNFQINSSSSLIRPPCLPRNCGHIREVAFGKREK